MNASPLAVAALIATATALTACAAPQLCPPEQARACRGGDDAVCDALGMSLRPAHPLKARALFTTACDRGHAPSCGHLGLMTLRGEGAPASRSAAAPLLERACMGAPGGPWCGALADLQAHWVDEVHVGRAFSCALTRGATVWCWGDLGTMSPPPRPTSLDPWFAAPPEDDALPKAADDAWRPRRVLLGGEDRPALALDVGAEHACAVDHLGEVWCWGVGNAYGTLGLAAPESAAPVAVITDPELRFEGARYGWVGSPLAGATDVAVGACYSCALMRTGAVRCWGHTGGYWDDVAQVRTIAGLDDAVAIYGGATEACARTRAGALWCGLPHAPHALEAVPALVVAVAPARTPLALTADGALWRWASPGEPPERLPLPAAAELRAWQDRFCVRTAAGTVSCADLDGGHLTPINALGLATALSVPRARGASHQCVATPDGRVRCVGANDRGQLGDPTRLPHTGAFALTLPTTL